MRDVHASAPQVAEPGVPSWWDVGKERLRKGHLGVSGGVGEGWHLAARGMGGEQAQATLPHAVAALSLHRPVSATFITH